MHKHVEWDDPGANSVMDHFASYPEGYSAPGPGSILSARHEGAVVRIRVEAYVEGTSIGEVVALIAEDNGRRMQHHGHLSLGDTVRLPDALRALEPSLPTDDEHDDEDAQD